MSETLIDQSMDDTDYQYQEYVKGITEQSHKEMREHIARVKAENNGRIPLKDVEEQDFAFQQTNAYHDY